MARGITAKSRSKRSRLPSRVNTDIEAERRNVLEQLVLRDNKVPKYQQIVDAVIRMIQFGVARPGEALPTLEQLAGHLNINRNTVQSAYKSLSGLQITKFHPGKGMVVLKSPATRKLLKSPTKDIESVLAQELGWALLSGLSTTEAKLVCERAMDQAIRNAALMKRSKVKRIDSKAATQPKPAHPKNRR